MGRVCRLILALGAHGAANGRHLLADAGDTLDAATGRNHRRMAESFWPRSTRIAEPFPSRRKQ